MPSRTIGLVAIVAALAFLAVPAASHAARPAPPAQPAPRFELPMRTGSVSLDSLRGRVVYVDFWASWCAPCRASFPWMAALAQRYRARGLEVVAIDLDKDRALADAFLAQHPAPFRVAFDPYGGSARAFGVTAMPSSFVVSKDGTVLLRHAGFDLGRTADVVSRIEEALAQ
jgi:thiol-disulfide isomerase/thioredoxin